jgi:hypothetical protein
MSLRQVLWELQIGGTSQPFDRHALEILKRQRNPQTAEILKRRRSFTAAGNLPLGQAIADPVAATPRASFRCVLPLTWDAFVPILMSSE